MLEGGEFPEHFSQIFIIQHFIVLVRILHIHVREVVTLSTTTIAAAWLGVLIVTI